MMQDRFLLIQGPHTALRVRLPTVGHLAVGSTPECEIRLREPDITGELARIGLDPQISVTLTASPAELRGPRGTRSISQGEIVDVQIEDSLHFEKLELCFQTGIPPSSARRIWSEAHLISVLQNRLHMEEASSVACIESSALGPEQLLEITSNVLEERDLIGSLDQGVYALVAAGPERRARTLVERLVENLGTQNKVRYGIVSAEGRDAKALIDAARDRVIDAAHPSVSVGLREEIAALERRRIVEALEAHPTQSAAAKALGIPLRTFLNRLDALEIPRPRKKD